MARLSLASHHVVSTIATCECKFDIGTALSLRLLRCIAEDPGQRSPFIHNSPLADITNGTHPASPTVLITPRRPTILPSQEAIEPGHGGNEDDSADDTDSGEQHFAFQHISISFLIHLPSCMCLNKADEAFQDIVLTCRGEWTVSPTALSSLPLHPPGRRLVLAEFS